MKTSEPFALPPGPKGLCFDTDQFLGKHFSVDAFLHEHRNAASPETLRDDLGVYLKVLRSAMIELIDRDYADFVDLSAGLTDLDAEMDGIRRPLGQLREEVAHVKECLAEAMKELFGRLERRRLLRETKRSLHYLGQTRASLDKLSKILRSEDGEKEKAPRETIERMCSEYVQLHFTVAKCENYISAEQRKQYELIGDAILSTSERMFLESLKSNDPDGIERCLQIYSTLDRVSDLENIVRKKIVGPGMHDLVNESALQKNPAGLKGVFDNILNFYDRNLKGLIAITRNGKSPAVKGYNFIMNSFWPEVEYRLEIQMSSMFAPGNPELFYSRYGDSLEFLQKILKNVDDKKDREKFYAHSSYKNFLQKWNLPIYFQIRFQEIAGSLETMLSEPIGIQSFNAPGDSENFSLKTTTACWTSLTSCWAQGVFIVALTHRFWKLSLQIISRYCMWINVAVKQAWPSNSSSSDNSNNHKIPPEKLKFLILLYADVKKLISALPTFLEIVKTRLQPIKQIEIFQKCLSDSQIQLESKLPQIQKTVILQISSDSIVHLKQINDIPRLYRKTNREIPTKPCGYVASLMKIPFDFYATYLKIVEETYMINWLESIFSIITTQYYTAVDGVLTSIQKTEDSLRRLKQIRDRPSQQNSERAGVSDDDKIRIQLKVDVTSYSQALSNVKVNLDKVDKLNDLINLIEKATISKNNSMSK